MECRARWAFGKGRNGKLRILRSETKAETDHDSTEQNEHTVRQGQANSGVFAGGKQKERTGMMKFYEYREEIPKNKTRIGKERLTLLWSFVNSGYKIAKVDFQPEYKSANSAYATLKRVIEKNNIPMKVQMVKGNLFLVRCEENNETQD